MAKTRSKSQAGLYTQYKASNRQATNRKRKLTKLLKQYPNNTQIAEALKNIKYRRCTPKTPHWSHTMIATAMLFKKFKKGVSTKFDASEKRMFSIGARAHSNGEPFNWKH